MKKFFILLTVVLFCNIYANASTKEQGINWIKASQQADGGFHATDDVAAGFQSTYEARALLVFSKSMETTSGAAAKEYLAQYPGDSTEILAAKLLSGIVADSKNPSIADELQARQNSNGGFGDHQGYHATPYDTYWAALALDLTGNLSDGARTQLVSFLLDTQSAQGGWRQGGFESAYLSGRIAQLLTLYRSKYLEVPEALAKAQNFLASLGDSPSAEFFELCNSLGALSLSASAQDFSNLVERVATGQALDGSWRQSVFATALCLRAQIQFEAYKNGVQGGLNSIYGKVVVSGSSEALSGAVVAVQVGGDQFSVATSSNGYFSLLGISAGNVNLVVSKAGYQTVVKPVDLTSGSADVGVIPMLLNPDSTAIFGELIDSQSGLAVVGASISIASSNTVSDGVGNFFIGELSAGSYTLAITKAGYNALSTEIQLEVGELLKTRLLLNAIGTVLDDSPAPLSGVVIDGVTGRPVIATATLDASSTLTTDSEGRFSFAEVARGSHILGLTAAGYNSARYQIAFPAGANGYMGQLPIFATSDQQADSTLDLNVTVRNAINNEFLEGAQLSLSSGEVAFTDFNGFAVFNDLLERTFSLSASADGYHSAIYRLTTSGFGAISTEVSLTPDNGGIVETTTVSGRVKDEAGSPVQGASVVVTGQMLSAITDATGYYELAGIDQLSFELRASKPGYRIDLAPVIITAHGNFNIDFTLPEIDANSWHVAYVDVPVTPVQGDEEISIEATIQNLTANAENVIVSGELVAPDGTVVAKLPSFMPGTSIIAGSIPFGENESQQVELKLYTGQIPSGSYALHIDVIQDGSISQDLPSGVIYATGNASITIAKTMALDGGIDFTPPLSQAGAETPVSMKVLVRNGGNIPVPAGSYQLNISSEAGDVLHQQAVAGDELPINGVMTLDFGEWLPQVAGHLVISIAHQGASEAGEITDLYYVGDLASAEFTLDRYVVPEGDSLVQGRIDVRGVDTTQGTSTDPLFDQVKLAVLKGSQYVGPQALAWHNQNRCLGCHIQTQSLVGMASSLGKVAVSLDQSKFLYNVIASSQQNNGGLYISHPEYQRTQTEFGAWSLVDWPAKDVSFGTKYKAVQHLWVRRQVSGNQLRWSDEHNSGWFRINDDATTAVVARAIADIVKSDRAHEGDLARTVSSTQKLPLSQQKYYPTGAAVSPNGEMLIAKQGGIEIFEPATNQSEMLYVDTANRQFNDVEIDELGVIYATTDDRVVRIENSIVTGEQVIADGLRDIEYLNGVLYVAEWNSNRIWEVSKDLQATVFASGGLLNNPQGLAVSHHNTLLIANRMGFNILEADSGGNLRVYAEGFAYPPTQIVASSDPGEYYVATEMTIYKDPTVMLLREDRTLEALFANRKASGSVYSLAVVDGNVYFTNFPDNRIEKIQFTELDRSLVQTLENSLPNIANYFLSRYTRTETETLYVAFRMVGLGEIYNVIEDESLKSTIASAMLHLDQLLRSRQRADGGWGQYTSYASDPLTTSWVGMALDYLNPSAEDPVVRKAIAYLLGQQTGNGSWSGRYFATRLGTTGMVMAYMPRALDRLAGLDVEVNLEVPASISVENVSPQPTSSTVMTDGAEQLQWQLSGVVGSGQLINMDMVLRNIQVGESRAVASRAELAFANSFTGESIIRSIDIPSVTAVSGLFLTTSTDKTQYIAKEAVDISTTVLNGGGAIEGDKLVLEIYTSAGFLVEQLEDRPIITLTSGQQADFSNQWNTGLYPAGAYRVLAYAVDSSGQVQAQSTALFEILPSDGQQPSAVSYATQIASDKSVYLPYDTVVLSSSLVNEAINSSQKPVLVKIRATDPSGKVLLSSNRVVPSMAPSAVNQFQDTLTLVEATPGGYRAVIEAWDADVQKLLASDTTYFGVIDQALAHLLGEVTVSDQSVYKGQAVSCTNVVQNRSQATVVAASVDYLLVNVDTQVEKKRASETVQLAPAVQTTSVQGYDTSKLAVGGYACLLLATINGEQVTLGYAGFEVVPPPANASSDIGSKGRLLVLLDDPAGNSNGELSLLQGQYDYLVQLLDEQGYSYKIVFAEAAFKDELYSGLYQSFVLMSELVTLSPEVEQVLTEAVNMGNGLMISGAFNRRNGHVERALGISITGREVQAAGVLIPAGALGEDWVETIINPGIKLDFERCGARLLGAYIDPVKGTQTSEASCYDNSSLDAAAAGHHYGKGYAVYIGFDTLDEATALGGDNTYRSILAYALDAIQPQEVSPVVGGVIPVEHLLVAEGIDVQVRVTIDLPENVALIDQVPQLTLWDDVEGIWQWEGPLVAWQEFAITQYLQLLNDQPVFIHTAVETALDSDWFEVNRYQLAIYPEAVGDPIASAIVLLQALNNSQIIADAQNAQAAIANGDNALAIRELLRALDKLAVIQTEAAIQARELLDQQLFILLAAQ